MSGIIAKQSSFCLIVYCLLYSYFHCLFELQDQLSGRGEQFQLHKRGDGVKPEARKGEQLYRAPRHILVSFWGRKQLRLGNEYVQADGESGRPILCLCASEG